ncbi:hypothetical protein EMIT0P218_250040 [Pseudomonas sp. IT-P218]
MGGGHQQCPSPASFINQAARSVGAKDRGGAAYGFLVHIIMGFREANPRRKWHAETKA